jgi:signal transduction histidine kinase
MEPQGADQLALQLARSRSELARTQEQLEHTTRLLSEALESQSTAWKAQHAFMERMVQDLRTPLTSLSLYAELLGAQTHLLDFDEVQRMGRNVTEQALRLARLIRQMTEVTYLDQVTLAFFPEDLALEEFLLRVVEPCQARSPATPITVQCPRDLCLRVDPLRLEQVLLNLLDNAIKFSPQGGPICVEALVGSGEVHLEVTDTGIGIPPVQRPRLFEQFYRGDPTAPPAGLGLGLYFSRRLVERQGGTLTVEHPDAGGTRMVIALPSTQ